MIPSRGLRLSTTAATTSHCQPRRPPAHPKARLFSTNLRPTLLSKPSRRTPVHSNQSRSISIWPASWDVLQVKRTGSTEQSTDGSVASSAMGHDGQLRSHIPPSSQPVRAVEQTSDAPLMSSPSELPPISHLNIPSSGASSPISEAIAAPEASAPLASIPERIGYLKEVCGIDFGWGPSSLMQMVIEHIHITGEFSWTTSIVLMAAVARSLIFVLSLSASDASARARVAQPLMKPVQDRLKAASRTRDRIMMAVSRAELKALRKEYGIKYTRIFASVAVTIPLTFGSFRTLRNMAELPVPAFETESWLWTQDLTLGDPYYILPVVNSVLSYFVIKRGGETGSSQIPTGVLYFIQRAMPLAAFAFLTFQPGAVQLYFVTSGSFSLLQSYCLSNPAFRSRLGLYALPPPAPNTTILASPTSPQKLGSAASALNVAQPSPPPAHLSRKKRPSPTVVNDDTLIDRFADYTKAKGRAAVGEMYKSLGSTRVNAGKKARDKQDKRQADNYETKRAEEVEREREERNFWVKQERKEKETRAKWDRERKGSGV